MCISWPIPFLMTERKCADGKVLKWREESNKTIITSHNKTIAGTSLADCQNSCLQEAEFNCTSFDLRMEPNVTCHLYSETYFSLLSGSVYGNDTNSTHYWFQCTGQCSHIILFQARGGVSSKSTSGAATTRQKNYQQDI